MRLTARSRVALAAVAAPTLLFGLVACGAAEPSSVAGQSAAQAASKAPRWDETTLVPAMKAAIEKQESVHLTLRAVGRSGSPLTAEADVSLRGARPEVAATMDKTPFGGPGEIRVVDDVLYLSTPPMTPEGKFIELRLDDRTSPLHGMTHMRHFDPEDAFDAFEAGLRKVTYVGEDSIAGQSLEQYRLTVDLGAAAKASGMPDAGRMHEYGRPHMDRAPGSVTFDVWLDQDALVHRIEVEKAREGSVQLSLTDWGESVLIEAPRQGQIVEPSGHWPHMSGRSRS